MHVYLDSLKNTLNQTTKYTQIFVADNDGHPLPKYIHDPSRQPQIKDIGTLLKCQDRHFVEFLQRCFVYDPKRRLGPMEALNHPFITAVCAPQQFSTCLLYKFHLPCSD